MDGKLDRRLVLHFLFFSFFFFSLFRINSSRRGETGRCVAYGVLGEPKAYRFRLLQGPVLYGFSICFSHEFCFLFYFSSLFFLIPAISYYYAPFCWPLAMSIHIPADHRLRVHTPFLFFWRIKCLLGFELLDVGFVHPA